MTNLPGDPSDALRRISIELNAIAESGLTFCRDVFDIERYHRVGELSEKLANVVTAAGRQPYRRETASVAGYTTPKLDVRAGIFNAAGEVLLVREIADEGRWTLPGGWCDVMETPSGAIEREVWEEAGVRVRAVHLAAVTDREKWEHEPPFDRHSYKLFFVCEPLEQAASGYSSVETSEVGWFPLQNLPPLSISRVLPEQIKMLHRQWLDPTAAEFD